MREKILLSYWRAAYRGLEGEANREAPGERVRRSASARARAAQVASSAGEMVGTAQRWGKKMRVRATRSDRVEGT